MLGVGGCPRASISTTMSDLRAVVCHVASSFGRVTHRPAACCRQKDVGGICKEYQHSKVSFQAVECVAKGDCAVGRRESDFLVLLQ